MRAGSIAPLAAVALVVAPVAVGAAPAGQDLIGRWATPSGGVVEFGACAGGSRQPLPCGRIVGLGGGEGGERLDGKNPDAGLRRRPVLGLEIVGGLRATGVGWAVSALYNPDDGRTYSGEIRLRGADRLELKGCALNVFCQTQAWRRIP